MPINHKDVYGTHRPLGQASCTIGGVEGDISHLIRRWLKSTPENRHKNTP